MSTLRTCAVVGALLGLGANTRGDCPPTNPGENGPVDDRVMLRVADYADVASVLALLDQQWPGITVVNAIGTRRIYMLQPPSGTLDCDVAEVLLEQLVNPDPSVPDLSRPLEWAELNYEAESAEGSTGTIYINTAQILGPILYRTQYIRSLLGIDAAHAASTGSGVTVAVLDTGVDATHPELAGRVLPGFNFVTGTADTSDVGDGLDTDNDGDTDEMVGHGTYVAGLIAMTAPDAQILPVVVLDPDGLGETFLVAQGVYHAIDQGVEVINMSFGSTYESELVLDAVKEARHAGIVVVGAAGNQNLEEPRQYPATTGDMIGVAATDHADCKAVFSNYNDDLFISAPGSSVMTGGTQFDPARSIVSTTPGGAYAVWEGTSMSAALVSGAVALVRAQHPEWEPRSDVTEDVENILAAAAMPIDTLNPGYEGMLGEGRLQIAAAVGVDTRDPTPGDAQQEAPGKISPFPDNRERQLRSSAPSQR